MQMTAALFTTWKSHFSSKMRDCEWGLDRVQLWAIALHDLRITGAEFELAKRKSLSLTWMPNSPAEFVQLARQANYPDSRQSYIDAANGQYDTGIALEVARRIGFDSLRTQAETKTYPQWQKIYAEVCAECSQGAVFELPKVKAIPMQPKQVKTLTDGDMDALRNAILRGGE